ncbi:MAG TPA: heme lyase CcmF/NrfE family subunit [Myxococcota bacterium]|nr:heme lyase CcmF/NrfE family subunit [Myxococcota bacterium]
MLLALGACTVGAVAGIAGGATRNQTAWRATRWMAYLFGACMVAATGLMELALLNHDFSVAYVAKVGSLDTPALITVISLWSSLEGSILFWGFILGASTLAFTWARRDGDPEHGAYSVGTLLAVGVFFTFLVAGVANPFTLVDPAPLDGPGPNALLQNHVLMVLHPPALYMGYVTMAVPFAMAVSALLAGRLEASWMRTLRRWMLFAWSFLTLGILLGGWWSYEVLGWGGYWAWDPVENASFMPWLTATAFLHSAQVMERRGLFKGWTITLALVTFLLTMLGTFMTRSGVFNSVHSFTQSDVGPAFLVFIALCTVVCLVMLAARLGELAPSDEGIPGPLSREVTFLLNNLLFSCFTFTVLLGTTYPLLKEAVTGERLSVGEPYFNTMSLPVCAGILFLMGVGPALPWGDGDPLRVGKRLILPSLAAAATVGALWCFDLDNAWAGLTLVLAAFAAVTTLDELLSPSIKRAMSKGELWPLAFARYAIRSRTRVAAYVVHFGVVLCAVAIAMSGAYKETVDVRLVAGETVDVLGYQLTYEGAETQEQPNRSSEVAWIEVKKEGEFIDRADPRMNQYRTMREPIGTPAVLSTWREDLYLSLVRFDDDSVSVRAIVEPYVCWLWIGGLVIFLGGVIGSWPRFKVLLRIFALAT